MSPTNTPPASPFNDAEMHRLFLALRDHVVTVVRDFTEQVMARVEILAEEPQMVGPTAGKVLGDTLVESTNLVVGALRDAQRDPEAVETDEEVKDDDTQSEGD